MIGILKPFEKIKNTTELTIRIGWLTSIVLIWVIGSIGDGTHLFPTPTQVITGFSTLWNEGLAIHIVSSLTLCLSAVLISVTISLILCGISPLASLKPLANTISKFRYLPFAGIAYYLAIFISDARILQIWVLVVFMSTFFITSILAVINDIPEEEFDHARALGCNRWEMLLEVVVKGRMDYVIECIRQNLAIVWMMLITVESLLAAAGGLGFLIKNSDKLGNQGRVIALQLIILAIGILLDFTLDKSRQLIFRYSKL